MPEEDSTPRGMEIGVSQSRNVLMFVSEGFMSQPICQKQMQWGIKYECKFVGVVENDVRHGKPDFAQERASSPEDLVHLLDEDEFLEFQRREAFLRTLLDEIVRCGECKAGAQGADEVNPA